jgi:hypothetical protein
MKRAKEDFRKLQSYIYNICCPLVCYRPARLRQLPFRLSTQTISYLSWVWNLLRSQTRLPLSNKIENGDLADPASDVIDQWEELDIASSGTMDLVMH